MGLAAGYMRVDHGCADVGVSQQLLDVPEISPRFQEMGREGVTKQVRRHPLLEAGPLCGAGDLVLDGSGGDVPVPSVSGGEESVVGPLHSDILPQDVQRYRGEHDIAVLPALPLPDVDLTPLGIDVLHL